jgi:hypothetical protein
MVTPLSQTIISVSVFDTSLDLSVTVVRFQVLTAASMKMTVFWDVARRVGKLLPEYGATSQKTVT